MEKVLSQRMALQEIHSGGGAMSHPFKYIRDHYGVPAEIGRRVTIDGKPGIITADRGNYIGVTLDSEKPGRISNYHPTDGVEYLGMGKVRKVSKSRERYQRYLSIADIFGSFRDFLAYEKTEREARRLGFSSVSEYQQWSREVLS